MTLLDISNGNARIILWLVFALLLLLSIILLAGHGEGLVAGYNTASKEEKEKYKGKKLSRVVGCGLSFITFLLLIMVLFIDSLPFYFAYIFIALVLASAIVMIILANTICRN